jgi:hypothetical protein
MQHHPQHHQGFHHGMHMGFGHSSAPNLGTVLRAAGGRSDEAEALFREALAVRRAALGEEHAETSGSACAGF